MEQQQQHLKTAVKQFCRMDKRTRAQAKDLQNEIIACMKALRTDLVSVGDVEIKVVNRVRVQPITEQVLREAFQRHGLDEELSEDIVSSVCHVRQTETTPMLHVMEREKAAPLVKYAGRRHGTSLQSVL